MRGFDGAPRGGAHHRMSAVKHVSDHLNRFAYSACQQDIASRLRAHALKCFRRGDHRSRHRHRLEQLVLDAAGDAQRRHHDIGGGEIRPGVGHAAGDLNAGQLGKRAHLAARRGADDPEPRGRHALAQHRQHLAREPLHRVDIRPVVHAAGEHQIGAFAGERRSKAVRRREVVEIDAVGDPARALDGLRCQRHEALPLVLRDEQAVIEVRGRTALEGEQRAPLARPDAARREACGCGVGGPLLGIDVHHVEDAPDAGGMHDVARHGGGEHVDACRSCRPPAWHPPSAAACGPGNSRATAAGRGASAAAP